MEDAEWFAFAEVRNQDVVISDLHESDERDRSAIFTQPKRRLVEHMLSSSGRAAFIVDEAVTMTEDGAGPVRSPTSSSAAALRPRGPCPHASGDRLVRH
jgi:hypothetical protein